MKQKIIIIVAAVIIVAAAVGGIYYFTRGEAPKVNVTSDVVDMDNTNQPTNQVNNLSELPEVVARVNGEEISRKDFETSQAQIAAGQGIDISTLDNEKLKQLQLQALDLAVSNTLLRQAAAGSGTTATDEEINAQLDVVKGQFPDPAKFEEALTTQGITEDSLRALIAIDVGVQKYLKQTLSLDTIEVTEEELADAYAKEAQVSKDIPPLEEIHDQFKAFVLQQKQQQLIGAHVKELVTKGKVEILM